MERKTEPHERYRPLAEQAERTAKDIRVTLTRDTKPDPVADVAIVYGGWWKEAACAPDARAYKSAKLAGITGFSTHRELLDRRGDHPWEVTLTEVHDRPVLALKDRLHAWDAPIPDMQLLCRLQIEMLFELGVRTVILTSGGFAPRYEGSLPFVYAIKNVIIPPGVRLPLYGPEHVDPNDALDPELILLAHSGSRGDLPVSHGTYLATEGPQHMNRLNGRGLLDTHGGDVMGGTLAPEIAIAALCGMKAIPLCFVPSRSAHLARRTHTDRPPLDVYFTGHLRRLLKDIVKTIPRSDSKVQP